MGLLVHDFDVEKKGERVGGQETLSKMILLT